MSQRQRDTTNGIDRRTFLKSGVAVSILGVPTSTRLSRQQNQYRFVYSVTFLCGVATEGEQVTPGEYRTSVNLHNPSKVEANLRWKVAPAFVEPVEDSDYTDDDIQEDEAISISCRQIREETRFAGDFLKGFVIIEADAELHVVAIYSTGKETVRTLVVEPVESA